jgi:hypothetical protein
MQSEKNLIEQVQPTQHCLVLPLLCLQVLQAVCTLLGIVMPRVPNGVLRAKWLGAANLISSVLKSHKDNVSAAVGPHLLHHVVLEDHAACLTAVTHSSTQSH